MNPKRPHSIFIGIALALWIAGFLLAASASHAQTSQVLVAGESLLNFALPGEIVLPGGRSVSTSTFYQGLDFAVGAGDVVRLDPDTGRAISLDEAGGSMTLYSTLSGGGQALGALFRAPGDLVVYSTIGDPDSLDQADQFVRRGAFGDTETFVPSAFRSVPEPSASLMLAAGGLALLGFRRSSGGA